MNDVNTFDSWLEEQKLGLTSFPSGFSVHSRNAHRHAGIPTLQLADVPLLLLAGAVEAGSSWFSLEGERNCRFSWERPAGPALDMATKILSRERIDFRALGRTTVDLPEVFWDLLRPFYQRCRHAPLTMIRGGRVLWAHDSGNGIWALRSPHPELILVDRGIDFALPCCFPGFRVVARIQESLQGSPWPLRLVWDQKLAELVKRVGLQLNALSKK